MIIAALREHTRPLHQRVEAAVEIFRRTDTTAEYLELLARLYGYYEPIERHLADLRELDTLGLDLPARLKTPLLADDLRHLGVDLAASQIARSERLPAPRSVAQALGCLYVLEGATLGGQFIRKQVEKSLGFRGPGVSFFGSYGDEVGKRWNEFRAIADREVVSPDQQSQALASAVETFETFEAWVAAARPFAEDMPEGRAR